MDHVLRRERVRQHHRGRSHPPRLPVKVGKPPRRLQPCAASVGGDRIADPAPGRDDDVHGVEVEFSGLRQAEILLVRKESGFEFVVEEIGEGYVFRRGWEVAEAAEVAFELRHAINLAALSGVEEAHEAAPRVIGDNIVIGREFR